MERNKLAAKQAERLVDSKRVGEERETMRWRELGKKGTLENISDGNKQKEGNEL